MIRLYLKIPVSFVRLIFRAGFCIIIIIIIEVPVV